MYCVRCGTHNPDDSKFCAKCGAAVAVDDTPAAAPPPGPPADAEHAASRSASAYGAPKPPPIRRERPVVPAVAAGFPFPTITGGPIQDLRMARSNTMCGVVAAAAGVVMSLLGMKALGSTMLLAAAFYAVIGFFIWKSSRIAAVLGLLMAVSNVVGLLALSNGAPRTGLLIATAVFVLFYWAAVRGTIAEHRLTHAQLKPA